MLQPKLLIFLFLTVMADALFHRLAPTIWELETLSQPKITTDPAQTKIANNLTIIYPENQANNTFFKNSDRKGQSTSPQRTSLEDSVEPDAKSNSEAVYKPVLELEPDANSEVKLDQEVEKRFNSNLESGRESNFGLEAKPKQEQGEEIDPKSELKYDSGVYLNDPESTLESEQEQDHISDLEKLFPTMSKQFRYGEYRNGKGKLKTRPLPTYPGFYKTIIQHPPPPTSDHNNSRTPALSTFEPISQTPQPVIYTKTTIAPNTMHNLSTTTVTSDMKVLCKKENAYYAIPYECDTFIECKQHDIRKYMCPDGLIFNTKTHWPEYPCAYPSEVECVNEKIIQEPESVGDCPRRFGSFPVLGGDCGQYVVCDEGRTTYMKCPNGLAFNPITTGCDWPENVPNCKPKVFDNFTCPVPAKDLYGRISEKIYNYKYRNSCDEYIACSNGEPRLLRCDPGKSFDEEREYCIDSKAVKNCEQEN